MVRAVIMVGGGIELVHLAKPQRPRRCMRRAAMDRRAGPLGQKARERGMVAMGMRYENGPHARIADRREKPREMRAVLRARIDDREVILPTR